MCTFLALSVLVAAVAAWTDTRSGLIPNWLTLGGILSGIVGHTAYGWYAVGLREGLNEGAIAVAGVLLCAIAPAFMYAKGAMGGGDLKLFAALGAICQPLLGIEAEMYAFVLAALIAPAKMAYEGRLLVVLGNTLSLLVNPFRSRSARREVPVEMMSWFRLGPAIFGGALATFIIHGYTLLPR